MATSSEGWMVFDLKIKYLFYTPIFLSSRLFKNARNFINLFNSKFFRQPILKNNSYIFLLPDAYTTIQNGLDKTTR